MSTHDVLPVISILISFWALYLSVASTRLVNKKLTCDHKWEPAEEFGEGPGHSGRVQFWKCARCGQFKDWKGNHLSPPDTRGVA
jgi:hypothetical protein